MPSNLDANDDAFLAQFETKQLPFSDWHHRAHLKVAYLYLTRFDFDTACRKTRDGIRAYNAVNNVPNTPTSGYHETMTVAWLHVMAAMIAEYGQASSADEFLDSQPQLGQKKILRLFYSKARFMSAEAKERFMEPDLAPLPRKARAVDDRAR
jgi:hypothetical protein